MNIIEDEIDEIMEDEAQLTVKYQSLSEFFLAIRASAMNAICYSSNYSDIPSAFIQIKKEKSGIKLGIFPRGLGSIESHESNCMYIPDLIKNVPDIVSLKEIFINGELHAGKLIRYILSRIDPYLCKDANRLCKSKSTDPDEAYTYVKKESKMVEIETNI